MASLSPHKTSTFLIGLFLLAGITSCHKEKIPSRDYPRVRTLEVTDVSEEGATFHGEIVKEGVLPVIDHGFVWGTTDDPLVTNGHYVSLGPFPGTGTFLATVSNGLEKGVTCYVRAFAKDGTYTVYGDLLQFTGQGNQTPVITDFLPKSVDEGDTLTIYGEHFSACPGLNEILIGTLVPQVYSASENEIRVILPGSICHPACGSGAL